MPDLEVFVVVSIQGVEDSTRVGGTDTWGLWRHHKPSQLLSPSVDVIYGLEGKVNTSNARRAYSIDQKRWLDPEATYAEQNVVSGSTIVVTDLTDQDYVEYIGSQALRLKSEREADEATERIADKLAASLKRKNADLPGRKGIEKGLLFVVMPMRPDDPSLEDVRAAIDRAAVASGLTARRVDDVQSTTRITDTIIALLETAEFVIADLTHARPNVFFEAGYAQGIGKVPIYIARQGTELEFDLKDYPVIFFKSLKQLEEQLKRRLTALLDASPKSK